MNTQNEPLRTETLKFSASIATTQREIREAQRLRFKVFNEELGEGLPDSHLVGLDEDPFDTACDHLIIRDEATHDVIGTYRMQTGMNAAQKLGYYSSGEFDLTPLEQLRGQIIELGRACIALEWRNMIIMSMLWRGIADYAKKHGCRYLIGCSSIHSQDERDASRIFNDLHERKKIGAPVCKPLSTHACKLDHPADWQMPNVPKLFSAYLSIGAVVLGPPAVDREFKTIDFLTFLDLQAIPPRVRKRFLESPN